METIMEIGSSITLQYCHYEICNYKNFVLFHLVCVCESVKVRESVMNVRCKTNYSSKSMRHVDYFRIYCIMI